MKAGERINCPVCGEPTIIKEKHEMDGWVKRGIIFSCALCNAKLGEPSNRTSEKPEASLKSLEDLLDLKAADQVVLDATPEEKYFCKDCTHFIDHPFVTRC